MVPVIGLSGVQFGLLSKNDDKMGRPCSGSAICLSHKVTLQINHKNYNFQEKKNSQVMREGENLHQNIYKGDANILRPPHHLPTILLLQVPKTKKQACAQTHVITTD